MPPHFDFAGSQNVKAVEVLWPAPRRLPEAGLDTIPAEATSMAFRDVAPANV